jgi:hypothetical protein
MTKQVQPKDVQWGQCVFGEVVTETGIIVTYRDGCNGQDEPCGRKDFTPEDAVWLANEHGRLQVVRQQLSDIRVAMTQEPQCRLSKEQWMWLIEAMIESAGSAGRVGGRSDP